MNKKETVMDTVDYKRLTRSVMDLRTRGDALGCWSIYFEFKENIDAEFWLKGGISRLRELARELASEDYIEIVKTSNWSFNGGWAYTASFVCERARFCVALNEKDLQEAGLLTVPSMISAPA
jgi:hypothetical protein